MKSVLDATVFFTDYPVTGECYTTPSVVAELVDLKSRCRYDLLVAAGLRVRFRVLRTRTGKGGRREDRGPSGDLRYRL